MLNPVTSMSGTPVVIQLAYDGRRRDGEAGGEGTRRRGDEGARRRRPFS